MSYISDLEQRMEAQEITPVLERAFDRFYSGHIPLTSTLDILRRTQAFMHDGSQVYRQITRGSLLDSTDCLTLAVIASLIASRKGVDTTIASPKGLNFLHAVMIYHESGKDRVFKLTGRRRHYSAQDCTHLSPKDIQRRLKYFRPVINFVNYLRFRGKYKPHHYSTFCSSL
jgi:hypothetical protein